MPPLPPNSTARYFIQYNANGRAHVAQFRYAESAPGAPPSVVDKAGYTVLLNVAAAFMPTNLAYTGAFYIPAGDTISVPDTLPLLLAAGTVVPVVSEAPAFISVPGRSSGGRRVRFTLLGAGASPVEGDAAANDYRMTAGENATVNSWCDSLQLSSMIAIDGLDVLWKRYMNMGYNAHWQRAVRP